LQVLDQCNADAHPRQDEDQDANLNFGIHYLFRVLAMYSLVGLSSV
jgi:hypothetical protein